MGKTNYTLEYSQYELPVDFPIIGLTGDRWSLPDDEITFLHCHNCLEIGYCYSGHGSLLVEDKHFSFHERCITVICPNTMHKSKSDEGTTSNWEYVYVDTNRLLTSLFSEQLPDSELLSFDSRDFPNVIWGNKQPAIENILLQILDELRNHGFNYQYCTKSLCSAFLVELLRQIPNKKDNNSFANKKNKLAIYPAIKFVENHYMNNIHISELATECNLSLTHFRRLFSAIMNESPLCYINHIRINKSCELLYSTEKSVIEIALIVGFSEANCYNRNFKLFQKTTPLQWRKRSRTVKKNDMEFSIFHV